MKRTSKNSDEKQLDFTIEIEQWKQLKRFIDDSIYQYEQELDRTKKAE